MGGDEGWRSVSFKERLGRVKHDLPPVLQTAGSAGIAYLISSEVLGHERPIFAALTAVVARRHGVSEDRVLMTAGGDDALFRCFLSMAGASVVATTPSFEMIRRYTEAGYTHVWVHQIGPHQDGQCGPARAGNHAPGRRSDAPRQAPPARPRLRQGLQAQARARGSYDHPLMIQTLTSQQPAPDIPG